MGSRALVLLAATLLCFARPALGNELETPFPFEAMINQYLGAYALSEDNLFRLAAYAELRGQYAQEQRSLTLAFGGLGRITFYDRNCLLRSGTYSVFHLDAHRVNEEQARAMNRELDRLFEQVLLLSNRGADTVLIRLADRFLARKNLDAFDKLFLRHLLIRFGRLDPSGTRIELDTQWLPDQVYEQLDPASKELMRKPIEPMRIRLEDKFVRGYSIRTGGTVYIEDVRRSVRYASGEEVSPNVTAFKAFMQRLFSQTTQYLLAEPRQAPPQRDELLRPDDSQVPPLQAVLMPLPPRPMAAAAPVEIPPMPQHPYHPDAWAPMMLNLLRARGIRPSDREILRYLASSPHFPLLYRFMTPAEQRETDRYLGQ